MGDSDKVKVQNAGQIWAAVEYGHYQDSSDNHLFVPIEDVERMVREAWEDGFCIAESAEGAGVWIEREWPKSQTSALLRAMMGE